MRTELRNALVDTLANLFDNDQSARNFLRDTGYPAARIPAFTGNARTFWSEVVLELERGIIANGLDTVVATALNWYQDQNELRKLQQELSRGSARSRAAPAVEPRLREDGPCFALLAVTTDQHAVFIEAVRAVADRDAELLYTTPHLSAVSIQDPGQRASEVIALVEDEIARRGATAQVSYARYEYRPYLLASLIVQGPDGQPYELRAVPATTPIRDIPYAVLSQYDDEAVRNRRGQYIDTAVDIVRPDGTVHRLSDPNQTLHEAEVHEGDQMRVGARATAGAIHQWQQWVERARAQIEAYARQHDNFEIVETDESDLPTRYRISITETGFALPEDSPPNVYDPVVISAHEVTIRLDGQFPREAPLVLWTSPVFHPNIARVRRGALPQGAVCLGALMDAYRPDRDFGELCQMLVDMAGYRNYEPRDPDEDTEGFFDERAAIWARSREGQDRIAAIGGKRIEELLPDQSEQEQAPIPLTVRLWGDEDEDDR